MEILNLCRNTAQLGLLVINNIFNSRYKIIDYKSKSFPKDNFNLIISLYSLDYHYDFNIYLDYLKKSTNNNSIINFDTIRYKYFEKIF